MVTANDLLGVGLYSTSDAALYARVSPQLLARWIYGTTKGTPVFDPQLGRSQERDVTFLDFVQALAIRRIRTERPGVSLQKIREAYNRARDEFREPYPFALKSTRIGLFGPPDKPKKQDIWICVGKDQGEAKRYFQLTGKKSGNQLIGEVVRTYTHRLVFDDTTQLARKYIAYPTGQPVGQADNIAMDPEVRFGEPFLESCGYTARTLYDAYQSEGTPERAAEMYGVTSEQITLVIEFFDYLKPPLRDTGTAVSL